MEPSVQFATTTDGVRIAYCVNGQGAPLVLVRPFVGHLQLLWEDPTFRAFFEKVAEHCLLVRYDGRGNGLSQHNVSGVAFDHLLLDLDAVIVRLGLRDIVLFGDTFGGPVAIAYAAQHPDRVSGLILHGTFARAADYGTPEQAEALLALLRNVPDAAREVLTYYTNPERRSTALRSLPLEEIISATVAADLYSVAFAMDVVPILGHVSVPTLILHRRNSALPFRAALDLANQMPNAKLVPLEGRQHNCWEGDAVPALRAVGDFMGLELGSLQSPAERNPTLVTILFTDMEASTSLTQHLGDARAQEVLRAHNKVTRDSLRTYGGTEIKHTGDGIMASFPATSRALECAVGIQRAFAARNDTADEPIRVRVGLNAGEPVAEEEDLFGTAVQLAARICMQAAPGQILVSNVVRELAAGKGFLFSNQGDKALHGFEDPVRLYEVPWKEPD